MGIKEIKVKYLYHSGFTVETGQNLLVFDYYKGEIEKLVRETSKNIIVFSSHSHADHFNPRILEWQKDRKDIQYVFSPDIVFSKDVKNVNVLAPYETLEIKGLQVKAYNSTDVGVSFMVREGDMGIFHAGDLNCWYWSGDTKEGMEKADNDFKREVQKIKGERIDLAFFPVDPRLEENYTRGVEYFIQELHPRIVIPMHFWDNPDAVWEFKEKAKGYSEKIVILSQRGQEYLPAFA